MTAQADYRTMTKQELVDFVAVHLFTQGRQSISRGTCKYRGPNGLKCAAGAVLPDELYKKNLENNGWSSLTYRPRKPLPDIHMVLISDLQRVHDNAGNWVNDETMKTALSRVYSSFELNPAILDKLSFIRQ